MGDFRVLTSAGDCVVDQLSLLLVDVPWVTVEWLEKCLLSNFAEHKWRCGTLRLFSNGCVTIVVVEFFFFLVRLLVVWLVSSV